MAVFATLSKGSDLDYIWRQVGRDPAKDAVGYYIQASESGGECPLTSNIPLCQLTLLDWGLLPLQFPHCVTA